MKYANGQEASKDDLIVFTDNSSAVDYDALGIVVAMEGPRNVRPLARRIAGMAWQPTNPDHLTNVALETAMPIGAPPSIGKSAEEITSCAKEQFRPGRALSQGICERCHKHIHDHPWANKVEEPA